MTDLSNLLVSFNKQECKGIFYRYTESNYKGEYGRIVFSKEIRPLKRISCPGCEKCGSEKDLLDSLMSECPNKAIIFNDSVKNDDIIKLVLIEDSHDRETGVIDACHYEAYVVTFKE